MVWLIYCISVNKIADRLSKYKILFTMSILNFSGKQLILSGYMSCNQYADVDGICTHIIVIAEDKKLDFLTNIATAYWDVKYAIHLLINVYSF